MFALLLQIDIFSFLVIFLYDIYMCKVPEKYIKTRWTKKSTLKPMFEINDVVFHEGAELNEKKVMVSELLSEMHSCVNLFEDDVDIMKHLLKVIRNEKQTLMESMSKQSHGKTQSNQLSKFEKFVGPLPDQVDIHPPPQSKNKGRPRQKRLKGIVEKINAQVSKEARCCTICNMPGHNNRTCNVLKQS